MLTKSIFSIAVFFLAVLAVQETVTAAASLAPPKAEVIETQSGAGQNGKDKATFEFGNVPPGGLTGEITVEANGTIQTFPYSLNANGTVTVEMDAGTLSDPNASFSITGQGYGLISSGTF